MTHTLPIKPASLSCCALMILALALAGCNRDKVTVQQVPKDAEQPAQMPLMSQQAMGGMPSNPHAGMDMGAAAAPAKVKWTLPAGWREKSLGEMWVGSFDAGKEGAAADVSIIPLPSMTGAQMELANLNMWRK